MTDTNERLRALFLAALMVLSVFAGTVALSGSAAANHVALDDDADAHLESGGTYWQGQGLWIDAAGLQDGDGVVQVRRINDDNEVGNLVGEIVVNESGANDNAVISTDDLDGEYVIVAQNTVLDFPTGTGVAQAGPSVANVNDGTNASDYGFEVAIQDLSAAFDEDDLPVDTGGTATIEMDSNRGAYVVNVTAEGLDEGELGDVFNSSDGNNFVAGTDADEDDDDSVQISTTSSGDIEANFTAIDAGSYTFDFEVNDTTATASASVDVAEEDVNLGFAQNIVTQQAGDLAVITVTLEDTQEGYLWVGGHEVNYLERVHFEDDDDDGLVTIVMNTRWAGTNRSALIDGDSDNSSAANDFQGFFLPPSADDDIIHGVDRFNSDDHLTAAEEWDNDIDSGPFANDSPLDATDYDLYLSSSDALPNASDDGDLVINDEEAVATLDLSDRSTDGIATYVAPTGSGDIDYDDDEDVQELMDSMSPSSTLAGDSGAGDRLVVMVNASGLGGYLTDNAQFATDQLSGSRADSADGIYLNITKEGGSNRAENQINLNTNDATLIEGGPVSEDSFLVVVDSRAYSDMSDGSEFTVSFQVGNEDRDTTVNAYVDDGEEERVETTLDVESSDAEFNNMADAVLQVAQDEESEITGTTNVAPGEEVTVRLRKTGDSPFLETQTVEVAADGTFSATFDTSGIPVGTEFTAVVREGSTSLSDTEDAIIVESVTPTPEPTTTAPPETTTAPPETTTAPPETTTAPPETTMAPETETESPGQPGFGVAIAIVALLGAALLALRRRD